MLVDFNALLADATANRYAVGYFESWEQYSLEAVIEAADEIGSPVIVGFGESVVSSSWYDRIGLREAAALGLAAASRCRQEVALIFNEVGSFAHAVRGLHAGFNVVMLDSGHEQPAEHERLTARLVEVAHCVGAAVEAEFGELAMAGAHGEHPGTLTDPAAAAAFVRATGIDALSVSVGNVHILSTGDAPIDLDLLRSIGDAVSVPLVLHGGTGLPDRMIAEIRAAGVAKINVGTVLKERFLQGLKDALHEVDESMTIHERLGSRERFDVLDRGKQYMKEEVRRRMKLYTV